MVLMGVVTVARFATCCLPVVVLLLLVLWCPVQGLQSAGALKRVLPITTTAWDPFERNVRRFLVNSSPLGAPTNSNVGLSSDVKHDMILMEGFFVSAIVQTGSPCVNLSYLGSRFKEQFERKVQPSDYGFKTFHALLHSFESLQMEFGSGDYAVSLNTTLSDELIRFKILGGFVVETLQNSEGGPSISFKQLQECYKDRHGGEGILPENYGFGSMRALLDALEFVEVQWNDDGASWEISLRTHMVDATPGKRNVERFVIDTLRSLEGRSILLTQLQHTYMALHGAKILPKDYGHSTLSSLIASFHSVDVHFDQKKKQHVATLSTTPRSAAQSTLATATVKPNENRPMVLFIDSIEKLEAVNCDKVFTDSQFQSNEVFAIDIELIDNDQVSLVQLGSSTTTYLFDVLALGPHVILHLLSTLLANKKAVKLIHDLHSEAKFFVGDGGIQLLSVLDSQLAAEYSLGQTYHCGFNDMLDHFGCPRHPLKKCMHHEWNVKKTNPFSIRPLPSFAKEYAILDVQLLRRAYKCIADRVGESIPQLIEASEQRAQFGKNHTNWRRVCFDIKANFGMASFELLQSTRPKDILVAEELRVHNEVATLIDALPQDLSDSIKKTETESLTELVLDLGDNPWAWSHKKRIAWGDPERRVTEADLGNVMNSLEEIGFDNRGGIDRQLHRISVIRNPQDLIVGMTLRVGRFVTGGSFLISDLLQSEANILILGAPGTTKTTFVRELARVLAEESNVMIIDTSKEIAGAGDMKHASVGKARRMFVKRLGEQRNVMIECIQNHRPDVMVMDELGSRTEAIAARTAAERGVRLIASAHGSFRSLVRNRETNELLGGIESVVWGDEAAKTGQTANGKLKKLHEERISPPVFDVVIELAAPVGTISAECNVILNTTQAVDKILQEQATISILVLVRIASG